MDTCEYPDSNPAISRCYLCGLALCDYHIGYQPGESGFSDWLVVNTGLPANVRRFLLADDVMTARCELTWRSFPVPTCTNCRMSRMPDLLTAAVHTTSDRRLKASLQAMLEAGQLKQNLERLRTDWAHLLQLHRAQTKPSWHLVSPAKPRRATAPRPRGRHAQQRQHPRRHPLAWLRRPKRLWLVDSRQIEPIYIDRSNRVYAGPYLLQSRPNVEHLSPGHYLYMLAEQYDFFIPH